MNYQNLLKQINEYALAYHKDHENSMLAYHSKQHTEYMADKAIQIANHYQLSDRDFFVVIAAAWFHDLGYMVDIHHHEEESAKLADAFLKGHKVNDDILSGVDACIMATKMPQNPVNLLDEIICDADLFHLGGDDFFDKNKLLRKEVNALHNTDMSKEEWDVKSISFLQEHHYQTDYCQVLLNDGKQKNLEKLEKRVEALNKKAAKTKKEDVHTGLLMDYSATDGEGKDEKSNRKDKLKKQDKAEKQDKGVQTMFRISSANHQRLSDMADNKAHIMITVNSIILSAIISLLLRRLGEYEYLTIPTVILLSISLLAMTFSILATRPSLPMGVFTRADVDEKKVNLLFFGNFYKMGLADYAYGMNAVMHDTDYLYDTLIKDIYSQGVVLGRKYRLLRIAYNIFMFGLIASVVAFIVASTMFSAAKPL